MSISKVDPLMLVDSSYFLMCNAMSPECDGRALVALILQVQAAETATQAILGLLGLEADQSWGYKGDERENIPATRAVVAEADRQLAAKKIGLRQQGSSDWITLESLLYNPIGTTGLTWVNCRNDIIHWNLDRLISLPKQEVYEVKEHVAHVGFRTLIFLDQLATHEGLVEKDYTLKWRACVVEIVTRHQKRHGFNL